jgi:hypothetical protein
MSNKKSDVAEASASLGITSSGSELDEPGPVSTATSDDGVQDATAFDGNFLDSFAMSSLQTTASAILAAQLAEQGACLVRDERSQSIVSASESETGEAKVKAAKKADSHTGDEKPHTEKHMWTSDETQALVDGCNKHGIGNWKAIISDEQLCSHFEGRTPGDLKDRFRTYFPDAYHEMYPNAKTHNSRAIRSRAPDGTSIFEKGKTKERRPFTHAEDEVLKRGFEKFGSHWAIIAKEPIFEGKRKSTDLRDRFRNAFPSLYEEAGYKPRAKVYKREQRHSGSGSFSHADHVHAQSTSEPRSSFSSSTRLERPNLGWRSDTSISASSQAVSEHSEEEGQAEMLNWPQGESLGHTPVHDTEAAVMSRSKSSEATSLQINVAHDSLDGGATSGAAATRPALSPTHPSSSSTAKHGLRRTQSSKRSTSKVINQEHAAKSASHKSTKEALLASHQHSHQQHIQQMQQRHREQQQQLGQMELKGQDESWSRAASESHLPLDFTQMDLDPSPSGDSLSASAAAPLSDRDASVDGQESFHTTDTSLSKSATLDAFPSDGNPSSVAASNAYLASLYRELGYGTQREQPSQRAFSVDSFQDLLDPLAPPQSVGNRWTGDTLSMQDPLYLGALQASSGSGIEQMNIQRRTHEHHPWAGDLLHRGNAAPFTEWPPAHVNPSFANPAANVRRYQAQQPSNADASRRMTSSNTPQVQHRSVSDYTAGITFNDMPARPARRLSNPPGSVGMDAGSNAMHQPVQQPSIPFSMDDLFLLGSNFSAYNSSALQFPNGPSSSGGIVFDTSATGDVDDVLPRRRSTDTLRGNANEIMRTFSIEADSDIAHTAVAEESSMSGSIIDTQNEGERMRDLLAAFSAANNDEADLPSRAASLGNLDLAVGRDQMFYAESLPDLSSSGYAGERSSSASDTLFPSTQQQNLPISFDDLDLPSFFNRSPSMSHLNAAGQSRNVAFGNPKTAALGTEITWPVRSNTLRPGADSGDGMRSNNTSTTNARGDSSTNAFLQPFPTSAFSIALSDAGTLDRLEHLYLEGLHTPASPAVSFNQPQSSSAGITPFMQQSQRFASGSNFTQMTFASGANFGSQQDGVRLTQSGGGEPGGGGGGGYESA